MLPQKNQNLLKNITPCTKNWLTKRLSLGVVALAVTFSLVSCDDPSTLGSNLALDANALTTTYADTFKVEATTFRMDSAITAKTTTLLVGQYNDPVFGAVSAQSYFQVSLPTNSVGTEVPFKLNEGVLYDSLQMTFVTPALIQGDTTKPLSVSLHRLTEAMSSTKNYTNTDNVAYDTKPILETNLKLKRYATYDTLKLRLPDELGREIFALSGKDEASTTEKFKAVIKGFVLKNASSVQNKLLLGLSASNGVTALRLYYHKTGDTKSTTFGFPLGKDARFNHIRSDFAAKLAPKQVLGSAATHPQIYMEDGTGLGIRIQIPSVKNLAKLDKVAINKAELVIEPDSVEGFKIPAQVTLAELDADNGFARTTNLITYLPTEGATGVQAVAYSSTKKAYTFNITTYLYEWLRGKRDPKGLALMICTYDGTSLWHNNSVSRSVMQAKNIKLKVYYSSTKK